MRFKSKNKGVSQYYKGKRIAVFRNYLFESEDKYICDALIELGYEALDAPKVDNEPPAVEDTAESDDDIRQKAKELGIKSWHVKKIDKLIKEIEEKESK